jgi:hypothetical protein
MFERIVQRFDAASGIVYVVLLTVAGNIEVSAHKCWVNLPQVAEPHAAASSDPSRR